MNTSALRSLTVGDTVTIEKGSRTLYLVKGTTYKVTYLKELGAEYDHMVRVELTRERGFGKRTIPLFARHSSRLADTRVSLHNGNVTVTVCRVRA